MSDPANSVSASPVMANGNVVRVSTPQDNSTCLGRLWSKIKKEEPFFKACAACIIKIAGFVLPLLAVLAMASLTGPLFPLSFVLASLILFPGGYLIADEALKALKLKAHLPDWV